MCEGRGDKWLRGWGLNPACGVSGSEVAVDRGGYGWGLACNVLLWFLEEGEGLLISSAFPEDHQVSVAPSSQYYQSPIEVEASLAQRGGRDSASVTIFGSATGDDFAVDR